VLGTALYSASANAGSAPQWMRDQLNASLPAHDEKIASVMLYTETAITVQATGKLRRLERKVYRILRPDESGLGVVQIITSPATRVVNMRAWSIPATGKDYEVRNSDAIEASLTGAEFVVDMRMRILQIPAAVPGSLVGYEVETEEEPYLYVMADDWAFQDTVPVREAHYTLALPPGWQYKATWLNHAEVSPTAAGANRWQWIVSDLKALRLETDMPPWRGVAGQLWVSLVPPSGQVPGPRSWAELGSWYLNLTHGRRDANAAIGQKVTELSASSVSTLGKMRALAAFVQSDIRYVAIELGIGGYQPHPAAEVFAKRYGDCKDKATLLSSMLKQIGVDSMYVIVDASRGAVTAATPPNPRFNHVIVAIQLPAGLVDPTLVAVRQYPGLGNVLFFDPTDPYTPFGSLAGNLQGGYGLLVAPDGGELVQLPRLPGEVSGVQRTAQMTLDDTGTLRGEVHEVLTGERAARQRTDMAAASRDADHAKALEAHLGDSFATFRILKATVGNLPAKDRPIEWNYSVEADHYAKATGDLLVVRPRVLDTKSTALLETREQRENPIEFASALRDTDVFDIALPAGYRVDDLPPAVDIDDGFAAYHSKTEVRGHALRYSRTFEIRELSVPADKATQLRDFYRTVWADERAQAVLKRASP